MICKLEVFSKDCSFQNKFAISSGNFCQDYSGSSTHHSKQNLIYEEPVFVRNTLINNTHKILWNRRLLHSVLKKKQRKTIKYFNREIEPQVSRTFNLELILLSGVELIACPCGTVRAAGHMLSICCTQYITYGLLSSAKLPTHVSTGLHVLNIRADTPAAHFSNHTFHVQFLEVLRYLTVEVRGSQELARYYFITKTAVQ